MSFVVSVIVGKVSYTNADRYKFERVQASSSMGLFSSRRGNHTRKMRSFLRAARYNVRSFAQRSGNATCYHDALQPLSVDVFLLARCKILTTTVQQPNMLNGDMCPP